MIATVNFTASITMDGEAQSIGSQATLNANNVTVGKVEVGASYALVVQNGVYAALIIYNPSAVDVAVQVEHATFTTNEFSQINLIAGGIVVIHPLTVSDGGTSGPGDNVRAKASSGTVELEFCLIS